MAKIEYRSDANAHRITLNDPPLHILDIAMLEELRDAIARVRPDRHDLIIDAAGEKAFSAGASVQDHLGDRVVAMLATFHDCFRDLAKLDLVTIALVKGAALGAGCELALACDFVLASDRARFGQPEIKLGILPGIGGSQRLTRAVGKSLAMDMVLTGRSINAAEAKAAGLVARVVAPADLLQTALEAAHTIAAYNAPAVKMAKQAVNQAFEGTLAEGLRQERLLFQAAFATEGQKEGMNAFVAKRAPVFRNR